MINNKYAGIIRIIELLKFILPNPKQNIIDITHKCNQDIKFGCQKLPKTVYYHFNAYIIPCICNFRNLFSGGFFGC